MITLDPSQERAIDVMLDPSQRLAIMTGGPGTGKTTVLRSASLTCSARPRVKPQSACKKPRAGPHRRYTRF
jgi:predicted ribonuclease YlaK